MPDPFMDSRIENISEEDAALVRRLVYRKVSPENALVVLQALGLEWYPQMTPDTVRYCSGCGEPKKRLRHSWRCYTCEKERAK